MRKAGIDTRAMLRNLLKLPSWLQQAWAPTQMDHEDTVILFMVEGTAGENAVHAQHAAAQRPADPV